MRKLMWKALMVAVVLGLAQFSFAGCEFGQGAQDVKSMTAAQLEKAGDECRQAKDYQRAIRYYREAVRKDKNNAVVYNKLGVSELKSGNNKRALAEFQRAVKINKKYADGLNNVGVVYFVERNFPQAITYFKKALALEENRANYHVNLGEAWFAQDKFDWAMNEFSRALELDPEVLLRSSRAGISAQVSSPEERAKFYYMLAKIQAKRGDVEQCLVCLQKAKENGYREMQDVYKDAEFSQVRTDARLAEIVPAPAPE